MTRILIIIILLSAFVTDDRDKGRKGNKSYHDKKYEEAARLFREGIAELKESSETAVRTGLHNNLGAALNRLQSYEEAAAAFAKAIETAETEADLSRAAYNAGNTAFQGLDLRRALDYYRHALLADPQNEDARFNYEFVRRMLEDQKQQGGSGENQQPDQQQQDQQQQNQDLEQQQDQEQEQQEQQQQQNDQQEQQQEQEQEQEPTEEMTQEQAEQILQALQNDEQELMRQVWRMRGKPRPVEKDW